jgi:hypothetical protein
MSFDQLGDGRGYRTVIRGERSITILQPAFDGFLRHLAGSYLVRARTAPARAIRHPTL